MRRLLLLVLLVCGCGPAARVDQHRVALPLDQVPESAMKIAHGKFPDVKFDTAWKLDTGAIEIRGKNKVGKIHEVELSAAGDIVEVN
jgi:hypothetical protein